jgi:hypothetical protein
MIKRNLKSLSMMIRCFDHARQLHPVLRCQEMLLPCLGSGLGLGPPRAFGTASGVPSGVASSRKPYT